MFVVLKRISTSVCEKSAAVKTADPRTERRKNAVRKRPRIGAVKNRAEDVDRFDQVLDQVGKEREGDRDHAPARGEKLSPRSSNGVRSHRPDERAIKIDFHGRAERVQFRRGGRHRGAKNHRHEQADDAVRQIIQNEGDERRNRNPSSPASDRVPSALLSLRRGSSASQLGERATFSFAAAIASAEPLRIALVSSRRRSASPRTRCQSAPATPGACPRVVCAATS